MELSTVSTPVVGKPVRDAALRSQLVARRQRLDAALARGPAEHLQSLLQEIDQALERMQSGDFGSCDTCHEPIENERLLLDPLCRNCLDHLSPSERRSLERDLDLAFKVQQGLLPPASPTLQGWSAAYTYLPVGPVSGDYLDLIDLDGGGALFLVGDVSGKGVAASMLMAQLHAIFRSLTPVTPSLPDLVAQANRVFCQGNPICHFATLICGQLDRQGNLEICNAGHCLPLRVGRGEVVCLESTGLPVGVMCNGEYPSLRHRFSQGESLVLYSDGLTESFNTRGEPYGTERLVDLLACRSTQEPKDMLAAVLHDLQEFQAGAARTDDLTVMVLRRTGE
jgi:sigma-B regulation protein RsbU (phosphoserine phosphatase)